MRKVLITVIAALITTITYGQSLGYRNDTKDKLHVGTNYTVFKGELGISLNYTVLKATNEKEWMISVVLYSRKERLGIDQGAKLLIRTFKGTVVELKQLNDCYNIKVETEYPYKSLRDYETVDYLIYPDYLITEDNLQIIMNEGIKKMRFEITKGLKDLVWDNDVYGKVLISEFNLINGKTDFDSGF